MKRVCIGLVGDFDEKIYTLRALNDALGHCRRYVDFQLNAEWISTSIINEIRDRQERFDGFWIVPGSPYQNDAAVYDTIRWARENDFPLLGTCGGFQYMVVEYARNVLGMLDASHAESDPGAPHPVITELTCSLKGTQEEVLVTDRESWLYKTLNQEKFTGRFFCSYGVNKSDQEALNKAPFSFTAYSPDGDARALELKGHRFFNGTLFQPSLDSSSDSPNPLIVGFLKHCAGQP